MRLVLIGFVGWEILCERKKERKRERERGITEDKREKKGRLENEMRRGERKERMGIKKERENMQREVYFSGSIFRAASIFRAVLFLEF